MPKKTRSKPWPIGILVLVLILILFGQWYFLGKFVPVYSLQKLENVLTPNFALKQQISELQKENENLRVQIFDQSVSPTSTVPVYSSYPFNNNQYIVLAAGSRQGVGVGDVVTYGSKILVGKVTSVSANESVAETIFNPNWEMSVRIGSQQINSLFRGGIELDITLIPQNLSVNVGDLVVTANQGLPYGLEVGRVQSVAADIGTPYQRAILEAPFKLDDLRNVSIVHF